MEKPMRPMPIQPSFCVLAMRVSLMMKLDNSPQR